MKSFVRSVLVVVLLSVEVIAQNPSFGGKEFRRVWIDTTVPQGASSAPHLAAASDLFLTSAGVFLDARTYSTGLYYIDDSGSYACATTAQPEFSSAAFFRWIGAKPDGSMIFCPAANNNIYPCQLYGANGLTALTSPGPEQYLSLGNYFDGRYVYLEHAGLGAVNIWYYTEGNAPQLWLSNSDFSDLATILDYDGETLAFATGTSGAFDIRLREPDGTLKYILGMGDPMPGTASSTFTGTPANETTEVDQGRVYVQGAGSGGEQILFSTSDGATFDIHAQVGQAIPGVVGVTISGMALRQVSEGKIWLQVSHSDGEKVLYQIMGNTWSRVAGSADSYDGRASIGFSTYEHGSMGDTVVLAITTAFDFSVPGYYVTELYVNGDLPGFSGGGGGPMLQLLPAGGGSWTVATMGEAGTTNTLQSISSLTNSTWEAVGAPQVADGTNQMEWTIMPTNDAGFFRLVE